MNNNNNNLYNNNFIGTTHIDALKATSNFILGTSNILEQHILTNSINNSNYTSNASNILNTNSSNYTNILRYDVNKWINEQADEIIPGLNITNTYISNSNIGGYIKFWTKDSEKVYTRINQDGKLQIYHDYEITRPTLNTKWYQVEDILMDYLFNMVIVNAGAVATGVKFDIIDGKLATQEGQILTLYDAIILLNIEVTKHEELIDYLYTELDFSRYQYFSGLPDTTTIANAIRQNIQTVSKTSSYIQNLFTTGVIVGAIGGAIGLIISNEKEASRIHQLYNYVNDPRSPARYLNSSEKSDIIDEVNTSFVNNMFSYNSNISNLCVLNGFINSNITTLQYIPSLKTDNLNINSGNINGMDINILKTSGNIIENGSILSSKYLTSNHIYNMTQTYTSERQYPPKLYTAKQPEDTATLLGQLRYHTNLYVDNQSISYGEGFYELYSSSTYNISITSKDNLFNFNTSDTTPRARWGISQYSSGTGEYLGNDNINAYYGDWVIIKIPTQISLSRYRIYQFTDTPTRAPSLWKVYGSTDGITFYEITAASQTTRLTSYTNSYYEKTISGTSPLYSYIGFVFGALLSVSGQTELSFAELQLFGKEVISNAITSQIYATSNAVKGIVEFEMPIVAKHYGFYITITTPININGTTYYKYDIDLRKYTKLGVIQIGPQSGDTFRSFKIRVMYGTMYFSYIINDLPNVCYYEVFMSYKNTASPPNGVAGLNACAIGYPPNTTLQTIMPNNLFIIKNGAGDINYITVVSTNVADCRVIIEDLIG